MQMLLLPDCSFAGGSEGQGSNLLVICEYISSEEETVGWIL